MKVHLVLFILIIFKSGWLSAPMPVNLFIVRNIGQGQWVSHVTSSQCDHYDFGGEKSFYKKIIATVISQCHNKTNKLYLSHFDLDHYSFYEPILKKLGHVCWAYKAEKSHFEMDIPYCTTVDSSSFIYANRNQKNKNASSAVFLKKAILIPGDSPTQEEKKWLSLIHKSVEVLILGHHGSKTSTSNELLEQLPDLKMAIASSRYKKYGHPHRLVVEKLKKRKIPLLKTEDWGSIYLHLI